MMSFWTDRHDPSRIPTSMMPSRGEHIDVAIAGAGLAGLTTAVLLARAGRRVVVLEARGVGAVTTGASTAKVSLLQGTRLSTIRRQHGPQAVAAYVAASREAQDWLREFSGGHDVPLQTRPAHTYATSPHGAERLREEAEASREAGLPVRLGTDSELPFPVTGSLALEGQGQLDPMELLTALAIELDALGGVLVEGARLTGAGTRSPLELETTRGALRADHLVLATGVPVLDRGAHAARLEPHRSGALTARPSPGGWLPEGMHVSAEGDGRTVRSVPTQDGPLLLAGGGDHITGRSDSPAAGLQDLERWALSLSPGAETTHRWAAQDYVPAGALPLVGPLPGADGKVIAATGFAKWGMTGAVAAALACTGLILGGAPSWHAELEQARSRTGVLRPAAELLAGTGAAAARGWAGGELRALPDAPPAEGEGQVGRHRGRPTAVSTVAGRRCALSAVCPHLGGVVRWNDAELTWDCPLHGSRFAADGTLLEGPAVRGLDPLEER